MIGIGAWHFSTLSETLSLKILLGNDKIVGVFENIKLPKK